MIRPVWVLPMLKPEWATETIGSLLTPIVRESLVVVDNSKDGLDPLLAKEAFRYLRTPQNLGCSASWNVGRRWALRLGVPLVIVSEAVSFLDGGEVLIEAAQKLVDPGRVGGIRAFQAWHLVALSADCLTRVGPFDEGFWPIYFEDTDYERRMKLASLAMRVEDWKGRYQDKGHARSWREGWVEVDYERQESYYRAKWGGDSGEETFVFPFGIDPGID